METRGGRRTAAAAAAAALVAAVAPTATGAAAQDGSPRIEDGVWMTSFQVGGTLTGERAGMPAILVGAFHGGGVLAVDDDVVGGSWTYTGGTDVVVGDGALVWDLAHTAVGSFGGEPHAIVMEGTDVPSGTLTVAGRTESSSEPGPVGPLEMEIEHATCTFASAEFTLPMAEFAEDEGWSDSDLAGYFTAFRSRPELADGLDGASDPQAAADSLPRAVTDAIELHAELGVVRSEALTGTLDFDRLTGLLAEAERIQAALVDPEGCAMQLLDGQVEAFVLMVTDAVASLIGIAIEEMALDASQLHRLAVAGVRTGALGAGSAQPARASALDVLLRVEAESMLADNLVLDGTRQDGGSCPCVDLESASLMSLTITAVTMGWQELGVGGRPVPAHELVGVQLRDDA